MGSGTDRLTLDGVISVNIWGTAFACNVDTVSPYAGDRWTTSGPRVPFQRWSMSGLTGSLPAAPVTRLKATSGLKGGTLTRAASESCRPENYFTFDTETGEIVPLHDLDQARYEKAITMIDDLNLNGEEHMKRRDRLLKALAAIMPDDLSSTLYIQAA